MFLVSCSVSTGIAASFPRAHARGHTDAPESSLRRTGPKGRDSPTHCPQRPIRSYGCAVAEQLRVVVGEDDVLLREGIVRLLAEAGFEVTAQAGDADDLLRKGLAHRPDVAVVDIQMPPDTGVLVLSQYYEEKYALDLIGDSPEGVGYLLKERVGDVAAFTDAIRRVAAGGSALDPEVVGRMLGRRRASGPLDTLSPRERDVLGAMAEGKSNHGISESLFISEAAVEKHVTSIFNKLGLGKTNSGHRRVQAVLTYLQGESSPGQPG